MDTLTVLNRALSNTGNNSLNALNDGSEEWEVADQGFERAIEYLISKHNWPFAQVSAALTLASDEENPSIRATYAFKLPASVVHLKAVLVDGSPTTAYELVGRYVCLDVDDGIEIEGYAMPNNAHWHPLAAEIVTIFVEAACLRGLNEDFTEARNRESDAEALLFEARPRTSRQNPGQNAFVSSVAEARRVRRDRIGISRTTGGASTVPPGGSLLQDDD